MQLQPLSVGITTHRSYCNLFRWSFRAFLAGPQFDRYLMLFRDAPPSELHVRFSQQAWWKRRL